MKNSYLKFQISIAVILFLSTAKAQAGIAMLMMPFVAGIFMAQGGIPLLIIMSVIGPYVSVNTLVAEIKKTQSKKLPNNYSGGDHSHLGIMISPLTDPNISVTANDSVAFKYKVTNKSIKALTLKMKHATGIEQMVTDNTCQNLVILNPQKSCTLSLQIKGNAFREKTITGPTLCHQDNPLRCYEPEGLDKLSITFISDLKKAIDESNEPPLANDSIFTDTASLPNNSSSTFHSADISQDKYTKNIETPYKTEMVTAPSVYTTKHRSMLTNVAAMSHMFSYPTNNEPLKLETFWNNWNRRITIVSEHAVGYPNPLTQTQTQTQTQKKIVKRPLIVASPIKMVEKIRHLINLIISRVISPPSPLVNAPQSILPMQQVPIIDNEENKEVAVMGNLFEEPYNIPLAQEPFDEMLEVAPPVRNDIPNLLINEPIPNELVPPANIARNVENNEEADERAALNLLALYHSLNSAPACSMMNDDMDPGNATLTQTHLDVRSSNANPPGGLQID
ncbi:MAG: hypothetical protein PSV35_04575, partial [bacterium]|nr:hypothetical protein [bacterium]